MGEQDLSGGENGLNPAGQRGREHLKKLPESGMWANVVTQWVEPLLKMLAEDPITLLTLTVHIRVPAK